MRILQIMTSKANGGAETYACDVITALHDPGQPMPYSIFVLRGRARKGE